MKQFACVFGIVFGLSLLIAPSAIAQKYSEGTVYEWADKVVNELEGVYGDDFDTLRLDAQIP